MKRYYYNIILESEKKEFVFPAEEAVGADKKVDRSTKW